MAKLYKFVDIRGTVADFWKLMRRLEGLREGHWISSTGEFLVFFPAGEPTVTSPITAFWGVRSESHGTWANIEICQQSMQDTRIAFTDSDWPRRIGRAFEEFSDWVLGEVQTFQGGAKPRWFPKKQETLKKWREAYSIIIRTRKDYRQLYDRGDTDNPSPTVNDLRDALTPLMEKKPCAKKVGYIAKAGDNGWLR